jgi:hypothetical protein
VVTNVPGKLSAFIFQRYIKLNKCVAENWIPLANNAIQPRVAHSGSNELQGPVTGNFTSRWKQQS